MLPEGILVVLAGCDVASVEDLGIYRALQILLPDERAADEWLKRPNTAPLFGGRSALDRLMGGQVADLYLVRQYLDAECGGWA